MYLPKQILIKDLHVKSWLRQEYIHTYVCMTLRYRRSATFHRFTRVESKLNIKITQIGIMRQIRIGSYRASVRK